MDENEKIDVLITPKKQTGRYNYMFMQIGLAGFIISLFFVQSMILRFAIGALCAAAAFGVFWLVGKLNKK